LDFDRNGLRTGENALVDQLVRAPIHAKGMTRRQFRQAITATEITGNCGQTSRRMCVIVESAAGGLRAL